LNTAAITSLGSILPETQKNQTREDIYVPSTAIHNKFKFTLMTFKFNGMQTNSLTYSVFTQNTFCVCCMELDLFQKYRKIIHEIMMPSRIKSVTIVIFV